MPTCWRRAHDPCVGSTARPPQVVSPTTPVPHSVKPPTAGAVTGTAGTTLTLTAGTNAARTATAGTITDSAGAAVARPRCASDPPGQATAERAEHHRRRPRAGLVAHRQLASLVDRPARRRGRHGRRSRSASAPSGVTVARPMAMPTAAHRRGESPRPAATVVPHDHCAAKRRARRSISRNPGPQLATRGHDTD